MKKRVRNRLLALALAAVVAAGAVGSGGPVQASSFFPDGSTEEDVFIDDTGGSSYDGEFIDDTVDDTGSGDVFIDDTGGNGNDDGNSDIIIDDTGNSDNEDDGFIDDGSDSQIDLTDNSGATDPAEGTQDEVILLSASADGVTVTVEGTEDIMNGAVDLSVSKVSQAKANNYEKALNEGNEDGEKTEVITVLDITLLDEEGEEVEPSDSVSVTFSGEKILQNSADNRTLTAVHVVEDTGILGRNASENSFEALDTQVNSETLTFETEAFSEYALVLTGNESQKEIDFMGDQYFELDKYLSNPTGELNGQNTYDVYLEQAYYDGTTPHRVENLCPPGQDIILVLDQSASMGGGGRVDAINDSTEAFLQQVKLLNNARLQNAKNGVYTDIDPNGDVEAQMEDHYMRITGIVGFNNRLYEKYRNAAGRNILSDLDVYDLTNASHITASDLQDCTRTDLALARAKSWINSDNYENTHIVLITDGAPYGYGSEGSITYTYESSEYLMMSAQSANDALQDAREMKDNGATIYAVYLGYGDVDELNAAFSTGDIHKVPLPGKHISSIFLSLASSDYPKNGYLEFRDDHVNPSLHSDWGVVTYPFTYSFIYEATSRDHFGKYIYMPQDVSQIIQDISS